MTQRLTPATALLLTIPPLLWAGNAVVGRLVNAMVPPVTLNFLRWAIALLILLPLASWVLRPGSAMWRHWRRFSLLGLLGIGLYNALQYLALQSSTPINVTLVAASMPVWMLLIGRLFFHARVRRQQALGAALSIAGVLLVLSRGQWQQLLALRLVLSDEQGTMVEGTFTSIPDVVSTFRWGWLPVSPLITQRFESVRKVGEIGSPLLVVHGSEDRLIQPELGRKLYEAAQEPKQFVLVEGGSHHNTNWVGAAHYRSAVRELFGMAAVD